MAGATNVTKNGFVTPPAPNQPFDVTVEVINAPASGSVTLSATGNEVQTQVIPPGGQDGQTITLNFNNLVSQNPDTDTITVDVYDAGSVAKNPF